MTSPRPARRARLACTAAAAVLTGAGHGGASPLDVLRTANEGIRRFELDNGLICLIKEDYSAPVVSVQAWVGTGAVHEQEYLGAGLSHFLEHMLFKGTSNRAPAEISKAIDNAGGDINAYTSYGRTVYLANLPADAWRVGIDVISDVVMNAVFPEEEWLREREVVLREVAMGRDDPERILGKLLFGTAYRVHPYRHPVIGHEDILTRMTREELVTFYRRHYVPDNIIAVVVGAVRVGEVEAALRDVFEPFRRRARAPVVIPREPPQIAPRLARKTGAFHLTRLEWAYHTVSLSHPDAAALDVLAKLVGSGRSARLVKDLVEERRVAVAASAWSWTPGEPGLFSFRATCDPEQESAVQEAVEAQVRSWFEVPFSDAELEKVKRQILMDELLDMQTAASQARHIASGEFYAGNPRFGEEYLARIEAVGRDDLRRVIETYLRPEQRTLVILSPGTEETDEPEGEPGTQRVAVEKTVLSNGIRLVVREDHRLPLVHISLACRGGLLSESEERVGITQLMADMLTRGTSTRDSQQIASEVESMGAGLSPYAGRNSFGLNGTCLSDDLERFAVLLADCFLHPTFPAEELEKQREIQMAALQQEREQPMFRAQERLQEILFPDHPYRWTPLGRGETVGSLSREDLRSHASRLVVTSNVVMAAFGDITPTEARVLFERVFATLPPGTRPEVDHRPPRPELPARVLRGEPKEQAIVLVGFPGVDVMDPRADALTILQKALSGLSSDLMIEIRDKRGLAYYAGAYSVVGLEPGYFTFYAGTRPDAVESVEALIEEQIVRVTTDGLREEEWRRAKAQLIAEDDKTLQTNGRLAQICALNELYGLGYDYLFTMRERLEAVTADDIRAAAAEILREDAKATSIVVPRGTADVAEAR